MLNIHQPYKSKYIFAFVSIGVFLLGSIVMLSGEEQRVYAEGDADKETRTLSDIETMQEMSQQICSNSEDLESNNLLDSRGGVNNYYRIVKIPGTASNNDGACWMVENLRLKANTIITPLDSDVNSNYTLPNNTVNGANIVNWNTDNNAAYMAEGSVSMKLYSDSGRWKEAYGNYYSWCAATAMSCRQNRTGAALINSDAVESICPKNWKLPAYSGAGSFRSLYSQYPNNSAAGWMINQTVFYNGNVDVGYNGIKLGYDSVNAFFLTSGNVDSYGLASAATDGFYWSRRAYSDGARAHYLYFSSSDVNPQSNNSRYVGFPIRCVVVGGLEKIEKPIWEESGEGNVNVVMPTVITLDAVSGMSDMAEANTITEGTITARVTSNGEHVVMLSAEELALKDPAVSSAEISPVSSSNPVQPGNNSWGIWNGDTGPYDPITTVAKTYDEIITDGEENQKVHIFGVGISISPALPAGTYATEVTVTAAVK